MPYALTDEERLQRIADIIFGAVLLGEAEGAIAHESVVDGDRLIMSAANQGEEISPADARILRYVDLTGEASPGEIRATLGLSRSSTWRALRRLSRTGRLAAVGHTRKLVYQIGARAPRADRIGLN